MGMVLDWVSFARYVALFEAKAFFFWIMNLISAKCDW